MLRDQIGIAVALANNAHTMGLAEQAFGAAHGMRDFIVVSLNSGVGSCIFSNGQAYRGADGFAGEVGHTCIVPGGRECGCGKRGCLETYCSAKGIVRTAKELMEAFAEYSLPDKFAETYGKLKKAMATYEKALNQMIIENDLKSNDAITAEFNNDNCHSIIYL